MKNTQRSPVFSSDSAVSSSIFVGAEREENLIRNDPDKSEFKILTYYRKTPFTVESVFFLHKTLFEKSIHFC